MRYVGYSAALVYFLTASWIPAFADNELLSTQAGPHFRRDGAAADKYGMAEGYPACEGLAFITEHRCRVGAFSNFDQLFPARTIAAPDASSSLKRLNCEPNIQYVYEEKHTTLEEYLNSKPVTGFLIAKNDTILLERYQYGRTDSDIFNSFSMAKSIVGLLVGIAVHEGKIKSIDDNVELYVPELTGTAYGKTPIKALLQMRSGIRFVEDYSDPTSDIYELAAHLLKQNVGGSLSAMKEVNERHAAPGEYFSYSSADTVVLGLVLSAVTGLSISEYASEKLWRPLGAEADASWITDATGQEIAYAYMNARLRDWARLGLMLANYGTWAGISVVPKEWLLASMANPSDAGYPLIKYGFQIWLSADLKRFAMRGLRGQVVLADPETKLVLVQTALDIDDNSELELVALWTAARAQLGAKDLNLFCDRR